jgi:hypothetical protein
MAMHQNSKNFVRLLLASLLLLVAFLLLLEWSTPAHSADGPAIIVSAKSDLTGRGAPPIDLSDLERVFAEQLSKSFGENVWTSASPQAPSRTSSDVYVFELTVDAMYATSRISRELNWTLKENPALHLELSLVVSHPATGRVWPKFIVREDHSMDRDELKQPMPRRYALCETVAEMRTKVSDAAWEGLLGEEFSVRVLEHAKACVRAGLVHPATIFSGSCLASLIILLSLVRLSRLAQEPSPPPLIESILPLEPPAKPKVPKDWLARIEEARKLRIESDGFSDAWFQLSARAKYKQLLKDANTIDGERALFEVHERARVGEIRLIAKHAADELGHDAAEIERDLLQMATYRFRLLQVAKEIAKGAIHEEEEA